MANKTTISGACLLVLGVVIAVGWFFAFLPILNPITDKKLKQATIVDSYEAEGYDDWVKGTAQRNPNYYVYYLWNMSNSDDVLAGESNPEYTQVGPFYYRYYWYNTNATFSDGGNKVEYSLLEDYIFVPELSAGDPTELEITNISPSYLTILQQAGGEDAMCTAAVCPQIGIFINFLTGEYLDVVSSQYAPGQLASVKATIISQLLPSFDNDTVRAEEYFYEQWANATEVPSVSANWTSMLVSIGGDSSSGLSLSSTKLLFESGKYSLVDISPEGIMVWYRASLNDAAAIKNLSDVFSLSEQQVGVVANWRNSSFIPTYVETLLFARARKYYPTAKREDIGWVQYINGEFTQPSVSDVYKEWYPEYPAPFELYKYINLSIDVATTLFRGPYGILDLDDYTDFLHALQDNIDPSAKWGISQRQSVSFLTQYIITLGVSQYTYPLISSLIDAGSGLITTKTVDYWLWRCEDPLAAFIAGPANASCTLQFNHTNQPRSEIWTGKDDSAKLNFFTKWRAMTELTDIWDGPVPIEGCAENGLFPLYQKDGQVLKVWDESLYKTVTFTQHGKTKIRDIDVYKYVMNLDVLNASTLFTNTIDGFANETAANQGAPVFLSIWDFYNVSGDYGNMTNMHPTPDDITTLYVEPITGNTLKADMKLQINFYFQPGGADWINVFDQFQHVPDDTFYPVLKAWQKSEVGDSDAHRLQSQLKFLKKSYQNTLRYSIAGAGLVIALIGVILLVVGLRKEKEDGYMSIQQQY